MAKKQREIMISGYGPVDREPSIALYKMSEDFTTEKILWKEYKKEPSFLCTWEDICFAVREEKDSGSILCYQRTGEEYRLRHELELEGGELCHLRYEPVTGVLYCSFYGTGHVTAVEVSNYHFTQVLNSFKLPANTDNGLTRAHCCELEPGGRVLLAAGISQDKVFVYETCEGRITTDNPIGEIALHKDAGPRHLKFHPLQSYLYVITEYSNEIYGYLYEKKDDKPFFTCIQIISTLPEGFTGESFGSGIAISSDGRFLYAANRGADTIAVFDIDTKGVLKKIQDISCRGNHPRHIALTEDDSCLMIANQRSNRVILYAVDDATGKLGEILEKIEFNNPSYVEEIK